MQGPTAVLLLPDVPLGSLAHALVDTTGMGPDIAPDLAGLSLETSGTSAELGMTPVDPNLALRPAVGADHL